MKNLKELREEWADVACDTPGKFNAVETIERANALIECLDAPKKLIVFREHGLGGVLYNVNSNVEFAEVITVDTTASSLAGNDASDYDEIQELAIDGDYGSAAWVIPLERLEERLNVWKARAAEMDYLRNQLKDED